MNLLQEFESAVFDIAAMATEAITDTTAAGYDAVINDESAPAPPTPLSLKPGSWLQESCVHGRSYYGRCTNRMTKGWEHQGEITKLAEAVRDAYQFRQSRATIIRIVDHLSEQEACFIGAGSGGGRSSTHVRRHRRISQSELNIAYTKYKSGENSVSDVMTVLEDYVYAKARKESRTFDARMQGTEEDLVSEFKASICQSVIEQRCRGSFSNYINRAWVKRASTFFNNWMDERALFESSAPEDVAECDDENYTVPAHEVAAFQQWRMDERDSAAPAPGCGIDQLKGTQRKVAELLLAGQKQKDIATGLRLSRHQVARVERQIAKKIAEAAL
ncbi:MAG: hypothetical protein JSS95_03815 [Acidobacteria bacterium]|nr:hypothetical protein [Acidobacteriota bacterium]